MSLVERALIPILRQEAIRDYKEAHTIERSKAVINGFVAYHDDGTVCGKAEPCYRYLFLKDLNLTLNMEKLYESR
jgi:hypothetical protein